MKDFKITLSLLTLLACCTIAQTSYATSCDLHGAINTGNLAALQAQLNSGCDPNILEPGSYQQPPLSVAASKKKVEMVKALLAAGADVNGQEVMNGIPNGRTAMLDALIPNDENTYQIVKILLENGAEVDSNPNGNGTPLISAVISGLKDVVKLLLDKGANIQIKSRGKNVLEWCNWGENRLLKAGKTLHSAQDYAGTRAVLQNYEKEERERKCRHCAEQKRIACSRQNGPGRIMPNGRIIDKCLDSYRLFLSQCGCN